MIWSTSMWNTQTKLFASDLLKLENGKYTFPGEDKKVDW